MFREVREIVNGTFAERYFTAQNIADLTGYSNRGVLLVLAKLVAAGDVSISDSVAHNGQSQFLSLSKRKPFTPQGLEEAGREVFSGIVFEARQDFWEMQHRPTRIRVRKARPIW